MFEIAVHPSFFEIAELDLYAERLNWCMISDLIHEQYRAYQPLISLKKALVNPCFWGGYVGGGVGWLACIKHFLSDERLVKQVGLSFRYHMTSQPTHRQYPSANVFQWEMRALIYGPTNRTWWCSLRFCWPVIVRCSFWQEVLRHLHKSRAVGISSHRFFWPSAMAKFLYIQIPPEKVFRGIFGRSTCLLRRWPCMWQLTIDRG